MSAPISQDVLLERQAKLAALMSRRNDGRVSGKITSEDEFINILAAFHHVEFSFDENQKACLSLFETESACGKSIPDGEVDVGDLNLKLYVGFGLADLSVNQSLGIVRLQGKTIDMALVTPDVLQRIVPKAQNQAQYQG